MKRRQYMLTAVREECGEGETSTVPGGLLHDDQIRKGAGVHFGGGDGPAGQHKAAALGGIDHVLLKVGGRTPEKEDNGGQNGKPTEQRAGNAALPGALAAVSAGAVSGAEGVSEHEKRPCGVIRSAPGGPG